MLYLVTYDYLIGGKYRPMQKTVEAKNAKAACDVIRRKYIPGYTRYPFHLHAERKEQKGANT